MSLSRAVAPTAGCYACSAYLTRTLASSVAANGPSTLRSSWAASRPARRQYTSTAPRRVRTPNLPPVDKDPGSDFLETPGPEPIPSETEPTPPEETAKVDTRGKDTTTASTSAKTTSSNPTPPSDPSIPWYLRTQPLPTTPSPEDARALIPELPKNPPPLLQTLLEYICLTAGLDDLHLLDLRHLDPPPALGPKLIMIICTARSEKHLHVSADRFCRYLRREHGLKADAAGLLGRNELKIKLRRKAKRMRMLANIGGREPEGNIDDGIRTGWICCTIGKIEAHPEDTDMPGVSDVEDFVGFRDVKPGVNVVVQMFTEEKRAEIDLERLWGGVLKTHERKDGVAEEQLRELEEHLDGEFVKEMAQKEAEKRLKENPLDADVGGKREWEFKRPKPSVGDVFPPASEPRMQQVRRLHTIGLRPAF
ncbi:uncharacterized protein EI97DRAFT_436424 [Westerdykella ornata]|uniref:ATPase synthesis protein 25 n=1 Tax=Westerdykella ornata TaxID=318751 RepID=A0A6A6J9Q2_WESOR|nr:uncharacterized protein EI97DRAFT_436424 [Westerdykella ornata]KAF2272987.1 hypothetical protein EI97DRAFT_436424 [Westerdykella ornata]